MNALWEIGKYYKFRIKSEDTGKGSLYNGVVMMYDGTHIKILDKKDNEVIFKKSEVMQSSEQKSGSMSPAYMN